MIVLIADDEAGVRNSLHQLLKKHHECVLCENGEAALQLLEKRAIDVVITDHQMPRLTGLELIRRGRELAPGTSFLLMTAFGSIEQAVEAIRLGADDYFMKPFDLDEIQHRLARLEDLRAWRSERTLQAEAGKGVARLIGKSPAMERARHFIEKVSAAPSPVLLLGPSGSGKEVLARAIHETGPRAHRTFVAINCASLSEQLTESELFGHEKGAFTGATAAKPGKFELASGGTLFLDEIGELSPSLQAKLLRVLQEREFYRVGGVRLLKTEARVITATHRPLKDMVRKGEFREDLFFRLNVLSVELPPLAERRADIPALVDHFWSKLQQDFGKRAVLGPDLLRALETYAFPGNVRELANVLERLLVLTVNGGVVTKDCLPPEFRSPNVSASTNFPLFDTSLGLTGALESLEYKILSETLERHHHNQVRAAEALKITRGALQYKMKKYGFSSSGSNEGEKAA